MARIDPHRRPHYPPTERMAILELRAARGWPLEQTARAFQVTAVTVASWMQRVEEQGPDGLVQLREPVNKFPDSTLFHPRHPIAVRDSATPFQHRTTLRRYE